MKRGLWHGASRARWRSLAALAFALALAGGCAKSGPHEIRAAAPPRTPPVPPLADSVTVGLWRFDERVGTAANDASPFRLTGTSGPDTRVEFGRYKNARAFTATAQSFVYVPYNPAMESPRGFTIELWLYLNDISRYEMSAVAMRWSPIPNQQSWLLGIVGRNIGASTDPSPGWFDAQMATLTQGHLVFSFRPEQAAATQTFQTAAVVPVGRWVHVAASLDGEVVRLFLDGKLDSQVAVANGIMRSDAPLVIGNVIDPRRLTDFGSDLRQDPTSLPPPFYALNGIVDEVRLSNAARTTFESADLR